VYKSLLNRFNAIAEALGLRPEGAKVQKSVNPWGHAVGNLFTHETALDKKSGKEDFEKKRKRWKERKKKKKRF
jgi:hypothetical protein